MEIHSSSLSSRPAALGVKKPSTSAAVQNNVEQQDSKPRYKQAVPGMSAVSEEKSEIAERKAVALVDYRRVIDSLDKPLNTRTKQALMAYQTSHTNMTQQQQAGLLVGVDVYA